MGHSTKSSPGRPRSTEAEEAIVQATLDLLGEIGYHRLSIEGVAARAKVGKTTIYRRYDSKEDLVATALTRHRPEFRVPDTGNLWSDLDDILQQAVKSDLSPLGRQTLAMIISLASTSPQFADIYWKKYVLPRRRVASLVLDRAKERHELALSVDNDMICDLMTGLLYRLVIFESDAEQSADYMRRALTFLLKNATTPP